MRNATDPTHAYLDGLFGREEPFQQSIRASAPPQLAGMMLSPHEGALLGWLAQSIGAKKIIEVGSFVGYSASWLLRALPPEGQLHCIEADANHANIFTDNLASPLDNDRVELHIGTASDILPLLSSLGPFDFVFIDADKRGTPEYLAWAKNHLRRGGIVAIDNTLNFGPVAVAAPDVPAKLSHAAGWVAMRLVNQTLAQDPDWKSILLPTSGGLTVGIRQ